MVEVNKNEALEIMGKNLEEIKKHSNEDTFLLLSYDLDNNKSLGKSRITIDEGKKLICKSETFILNEDIGEDRVSVLTIYSKKQEDIFNIILKGEKYDVILLSKFQ